MVIAKVLVIFNISLQEENKPHIHHKMNKVFTALIITLVATVAAIVINIIMGPHPNNINTKELQTTTDLLINKTKEEIILLNLSFPLMDITSTAITTITTTNRLIINLTIE